MSPELMGINWLRGQQKQQNYPKYLENQGYTVLGKKSKKLCPFLVKDQAENILGNKENQNILCLSVSELNMEVVLEKICGKPKLLTKLQTAVYERKVKVKYKVVVYSRLVYYMDKKNPSPSKKLS